MRSMLIKLPAVAAAPYSRRLDTVYHHSGNIINCVLPTHHMFDSTQFRAIIQHAKIDPKSEELIVCVRLTPKLNSAPILK